MRIAVIGMFVSISEAEVRRWLREAEPGQVMRYFRGFLARGANAQGEVLSEQECGELSRVATHLWCAAQRKHIHLVQFRHGPEDFTYIAVARGHRRQHAGHPLVASSQ